MLRKPAAADAIARELALLAYALFFWRMAPDAPASGRHAFSHRRGYGLVLGTLIALALIEMSIVHLLLRNTSATWAKVLLVLSAYGIVWVLGDFQALRLRPIVVGDGTLCVRVGLRREARIPLENVERIEPLPAAGEPDRRTGYVRCTAFGPPELLLRLRSPVNLEQMLGSTRPREVWCIGLAVDDSGAFSRIVTGP
ncbi:hypothetical protein LVJ94_29570 [Pendulispora rubella]|uniref:Uncharacterized protein n=1 Tax=Pendulispora rubella TaxID=2741070 RepID=A0ABZ2KQU9_9BACT